MGITNYNILHNSNTRDYEPIYCDPCCCCCCCCCCCMSAALGGACMCGGIPCITSGLMGGGIKAVLTRNSIILYHSGSTPAFSCSAVTCCRCPISFSQARRQLTFPCSSISKPSSGEMGMGPAIVGGKRMPGIMGKLGSNVRGLYL